MTKTATKPDHLMTGPELAESLNITDRRIRQLAIDGFIKSPARGLYDAAWAFHYYTASKAAPDRVKDLGPEVMVAFSWAGVQPRNIPAEDLALFVELFKRNGYTRDFALVTIGTARAFLKN